MARRGHEGKIQDAVIKYAREEYGALCKKNEVGRFFVGSGWPDYVIFPRLKTRRHRPFMCEFKAPGGVLTPLQEEMKRQIEGLGYNYYKINSIVYGKIVIDQECG